MMDNYQSKNLAVTSLTINQVLMVVYDLPYLVLPDWYLPSKEERKILDPMQRDYRAIVRWLDGYFSGRNPDLSDPALYFGYGCAVLYRRLHDICFDLVARGAIEGITPENRNWFHLSLWSGAIVSQCQWVLKGKNIPNRDDPNIVGKEADCKTRSQAISAYSLSPKTQRHQRKPPGGDYQQVKLLKVDPGTFDTQTLFWHWLNGQAWKLAKRDKYFRDNFWEPYLTTFATLNNVVKDSDSFQIQYLLPNDTVFTTKKYRPLPRRRKQREC